MQCTTRKILRRLIHNTVYPWLVICLSLVGSSALLIAQAGDGFSLNNVSSKCGIDFVHFNGRTGKFYLVETICSGIALLDFDSDGKMDVFFLNGSFLPGTPASVVDTVPRPTNRLYRNLGDWRFVDVTNQAGVGDVGHSLGVVAGDIDNDGDLDLYVSNFGPNVLYENQGDGTFQRRQFDPIADGDRLGAGAVFLDIDLDGNLDLFVANYAKFNFEKKINRMIFGVQASAGPLDYPPESNSLFRNLGDGSFQDISIASGVAADPKTGMGAISLDFDGDGDFDIFVCNDTMVNSLYENHGGGVFSDEASITGVATNYAGSALASMGVDCGDYDNDGLLDLIVTNFEDEVPALYRNSGKGYFDDVGLAAGLGVADRTVKWGVVLADFDNDSMLDCYIACGHVIDTVGKFDDTAHFAAKNLVLRGNGRKFLNVSANSGDAMDVREVSRGVGADDLDNDGDLDLIVLNANAPPTVIRNDLASTSHWIQFSLTGVHCNRDAVGAKVRIQFSDQFRVAEVHAGRGYQSHYGSRLHFGLGEYSGPVNVEIQWPGGATQTLSNVVVDRHYRVVESR